MFILNLNHKACRTSLECEYIRHSPSETITVKTVNSQKYNNIIRENSVISLLESYLDLNFDVLHAATGNRYADGNDIKLVNLIPIAFFVVTS